jgi:hypothetical protein
MSKLKSKPPNIDRLIEGVRSISENRCSLSEEEVKLLNECIDLLEGLKHEIAMDEKRAIFSKAMVILLRIFKDDIQNLLDKFM